MCIFVHHTICIYDAVFYGAGESFSFQDNDLLEYYNVRFNKLVLIFRKKYLLPSSEQKRMEAVDSAEILVNM